MHTYEIRVQAFIYHVKTEKLAFIDKNLLEQFCHPLCTENDHSGLYHLYLNHDSKKKFVPV